MKKNSYLLSCLAIAVSSACHAEVLTLLIGHSQNYYLLEVDLKTGRHHQIRCQLAKMGCPIKGDLKYGFPRSNPDGSICLHARTVQFVHPVSKEMIQLTAPVPEGNLWNGFEMD